MRYTRLTGWTGFLGFWVLGFGFWVFGFLGFGFLVFGFWVLGFGFWVLGFGFGPDLFYRVETRPLLTAGGKPHSPAWMPTAPGGDLAPVP